MTSNHLSNYLRTHRKRLSLSQEEVAFLLGVQSGAKVCRHEMFACEPNLATALAYQVILQKPANELFAGLYKQIEREVAARAKVLTHRVNRGNAKRRKKQPEIISTLAALHSSRSNKRIIS